MDAGNAVKEAFRSRGLAQADYCRASGRFGSSVSKSISRGDAMTVAVLEDMLAFAGYRLVAVPVGAKLPDGSLPVGDDAPREAPVPDGHAPSPKAQGESVTPEEAAALKALYAKVFGGE